MTASSSLCTPWWPGRGVDPRRALRHRAADHTSTWGPSQDRGGESVLRARPDSGGVAQGRAGAGVTSSASSSRCSPASELPTAKTRSAVSCGLTINTVSHGLLSRGTASGPRAQEEAVRHAQIRRSSPLGRAAVGNLGKRHGAGAETRDVVGVDRRVEQRMEPVHGATVAHDEAELDQLAPLRVSAIFHHVPAAWRGTGPHARHRHRSGGPVVEEDIGTEVRTGEVVPSAGVSLLPRAFRGSGTLRRLPILVRGNLVPLPGRRAEAG
jgi:hypothetical protein